MVHINDVTTWPTGCTLDRQAAKIMEEAHEIWDAVVFEEGRDRVLEECEDVIQATCNLLAIMGVDDFVPYMQECLERNRERGRL